MPATQAQTRDETVSSPAGVQLAARQSGDPDGPAVVALHGLFGTRDQVLIGSTRLEEAGMRVIVYDARGHGRSTAPDDPGAYTYDLLLADLAAVLDAFEVERAMLLGASMGAHTALRLALEQPARVAGLVVLTPAYDPDDHPHPGRMRRAIKLSEGLRLEGVEGFTRALEPAPGWGERFATFQRVVGMRMRKHANLLAVADALPVVSRARPFEALSQLGAVEAPAIVVGTRDDYDDDHPLELAERYATALGARFVCEPEGRMPLAWYGGAVAREALGLTHRVFSRPL